MCMQMGLEPRVAASTGALMVLFTSSSTVVQFAVLGNLPWGASRQCRILLQY
jgi:uncharacterized membrane protein YfcA